MIFQNLGGPQLHETFAFYHYTPELVEAFDIDLLRINDGVFTKDNAQRCLC